MSQHRESGHKIRECVVDGIFYPSEKEELEQTISGFFSEASPHFGSAPAVVAPHAGYRYAGHCMAAAFGASGGRSVRRIVILAPVHRDPGVGFFLPESDVFSVPNGQIPIDKDAIKEISSSGAIFQLDDIPHLEEHCVEVQLPFLSYLFSDFSIVPILVGNTTPADVLALSRTLERLYGERIEETLFVVSSNLTTYGPFESGKQSSDHFLQMLEHGDVDGILKAKAAGSISTCCAAGIAALLMLESPKLQPRVVCRGNSAAGNNDVTNGIHYAAIAFDEVAPKTR